MTQIICDRCLKSADTCQRVMAIDGLDSRLYFDLCDNCIDDFIKKFMTEKKAGYMSEPGTDNQACPPPPKGV